MNNLHHCEGELPQGGYGEAILECTENKSGELWVSNGEYASQVNFCPYCGREAKVKAVIAQGHPIKTNIGDTNAAIFMHPDDGSPVIVLGGSE